MRIIGDYHTHTIASDGRTDVQTMVSAAKEKGLQEIAITDHGPKKANGLRMKNFDHYVSEIEASRSIMPVLIGIETNLMCTSGKIDLPQNLADKMDVVIMGVHLRVSYTFRAFFTFFLPNLFWRIIKLTPKRRVRKNTEAVKRAIQNNKVDIWAHPSLYFKVDVVEVAKTCAEKGTLIELNGKRISFRPIDFERMAALGAKFIINSDAHDPSNVGQIDRVTEFLKNCDYNESCIINLKQTLSDYKKHGVH